MMHIFDNTPETLFTKSATVIKTALAVKSEYTGSPATHVYIVANVDFEGDARIMRMRVEAHDHPCAPLLVPGDRFSIAAPGFKGDRTYPRELRPHWPMMFEQLPVPEGQEVPELLMRATILRKVEGMHTDHQHPESEVYLKLKLEDGSTTYCCLKAWDNIDAVLAEEGYEVSVRFKGDRYTRAGGIWVKDFKVNWGKLEQLKAKA